MIVTLDGPAGAGKSSAARQLAQRLGFRFLDTGAMYRAVTLAGMQAGIDLDDEAALARVAAEMDLELTGEQVLLAGQSVTRAIRTFEVTTLTRHAADNQQVRKLLVDRQRAWAAGCAAPASLFAAVPPVPPSAAEPRRRRPWIATVSASTGDRS